MNHDLLFQLFYNLIHNAIRYNSVKGSIVITDDFTRGESYSIHITDTGIGIPPEETGNIFSRFKKANRHNSEGYGLGLAIVKSIADYHNLKLVVNSQLNKGTSFRLIFPISR
jgi:two-component system sensor histidine kinase ArlS